MEEFFYTTEEVAKMFRVSMQTVQNWLRSGEIQGIKIGKQWRIPKEEIDNLKERAIKNAG
mgnify:CR=1 FL=1